jgi:hypothetical protein
MQTTILFLSFCLTVIALVAVTYRHDKLAEDTVSLFKELFQILLMKRKEYFNQDSAQWLAPSTKTSIGRKKPKGKKS